MSCSWNAVRIEPFFAMANAHYIWFHTLNSYLWFVKDQRPKQTRIILCEPSPCARVSDNHTEPSGTYGFSMAEQLLMNCTCNRKKHTVLCKISCATQASRDIESVQSLDKPRRLIMTFEIIRVYRKPLGKKASGPSRSCSRGWDLMNTMSYVLAELHY